MFLCHFKSYFDITKCTVKKKRQVELKIWRQPASADFWVLSTYFCRRFSTFCCINLKQQVEKTKKSAEAGWLNFSFFTVWLYLSMWVDDLLFKISLRMNGMFIQTEYTRTQEVGFIDQSQLSISSHINHITIRRRWHWGRGGHDPPPQIHSDPLHPPHCLYERQHR